jgi:hypothetical protein
MKILSNHRRRLEAFQPIAQLRHRGFSWSAEFSRLCSICLLRRTVAVRIVLLSWWRRSLILIVGIRRTWSIRLLAWHWIAWKESIKLRVITELEAAFIFQLTLLLMLRIVMWIAARRLIRSLSRGLRIAGDRSSWSGIAAWNRRWWKTTRRLSWRWSLIAARIRL